MTGFSIGARTTAPHAGLARRVRILVAGRQTPVDAAAAIVLLLVSVGATFANLVLAVLALPSFRECAGASCGYGTRLDVYATTFIVSLLVGTTFGVHSVLKLLNRRSAWGYAFLDACVSAACLLSGLLWVSNH